MRVGRRRADRAGRRRCEVRVCSASKVFSSETWSEQFLLLICPETRSMQRVRLIRQQTGAQNTVQFGNGQVLINLQDYIIYVYNFIDRFILYTSPGAIKNRHTRAATKFGFIC